MKYLWLIVCLIFLGGCGGRTYEQNVTIPNDTTTSGKQPIVVLVVFDSSAASNDADFKSSLATEAASAVAGVVDKVTTALDKRQSDVGNNKSVQTTKTISSTPSSNGTVETEETISTTKLYPTKYHHTLVGGTDEGVSFVSCPNDKLNYKSCSCSGVDMPQHGSIFDTLDSEDRQGWWAMGSNSEPATNVDIICITQEDKKVYYKIDKEKINLYGDCD